MFRYSPGGKRIGESSSSSPVAPRSRGYHHVKAVDLSSNKQSSSSKLQHEDPKSDLDILSGRSPSVCHGVVAIAGRRRQMEDAVSAVPAFLSIQGEGEIPVTYLHHFFGVYHGLEAAEFCKNQLHLAILEEVTNYIEDPASIGSIGLDSSQWERIIASSFSKVDAKFSDCYDIIKQTSRNGTVDVIRLAAVVVILNRQQIIIANCGESRAVLCRRGKPVALSKETKSSALMAEPAVDFHPRTADDEFLILATPGLWNVINSDIACEVVAKCLSVKKKLQRQRHRKQKHQQEPTSTSTIQEEEGQSSPKKNNGAACAAESGSDFAAAFLVKLAFSRGSNKNISVVVVDLKQLNGGNNHNKSKE